MFGVLIVCCVYCRLQLSFDKTSCRIFLHGSIKSKVESCWVRLILFHCYRFRLFGYCEKHHLRAVDCLSVHRRYGVINESLWVNGRAYPASVHQHSRSSKGRHKVSRSRRCFLGLCKWSENTDSSISRRPVTTR